MSDRTILLVVHVEREEATKVAATFANDVLAEGVAIRIFDVDAGPLRDAGDRGDHEPCDRDGPVGGDCVTFVEEHPAGLRD